MTFPGSNSIAWYRHHGWLSIESSNRYISLTASYEELVYLFSVYIKKGVLLSSGWSPFCSEDLCFISGLTEKCNLYASIIQSMYFPGSICKVPSLSQENLTSKVEIKRSWSLQFEIVQCCFQLIDERLWVLHSYSKVIYVRGYVLVMITTLAHI